MGWFFSTKNLNFSNLLCFMCPPIQLIKKKFLIYFLLLYLHLLSCFFELWRPQYFLLLYMAGLFVHMMSKLAGPIYSGANVAPFSKRSVPVTFFKELKVCIIKPDKLLVLLGLNLGSHWKQFSKGNAKPLSEVTPAYLLTGISIIIGCEK